MAYQASLSTPLHPITTENILYFIRIILVNEAMMNTHFLRQCHGSIHDFVAGSLYGGIVDGFVPADGVAYNFRDNEQDSRHV
jgi:hypothetical protein